MIEYFAGDERPAWQPTVSVNGTTEDMTTGFTFTVKAIDQNGSIDLTKTTGIAGGPGGVVTVTWAAGELALTPGRYTVQLTGVRNSDGLDWTIQDQMLIKKRY